MRLAHPPKAFVLVFATVLAASSAVAQEAQPEPESSPLVRKPPRTEQITIVNFAIEANAVEERLRNIDAALESTGLREEVDEALAKVAVRVDVLREQFGSLRTRRMMNSEINSLISELDLQEAAITRQIDRLARRARELGALAEQTEADIELWTRAVRESRSPSVPRDVRERAIAILKRLKQARAGLEQKEGALLSLQSRALEVLDVIDKGQDLVEAARRKQARSIFERQDPPFWEEAPPAKESEEDVERAGYEIRFSRPAVTTYLQEVWGTSLLQLLFILGLGWLFTRIRAALAARLEKRNQEGRIPWEDQAIEAMRRPWAAALLAGIASFRLFYPERVVDMIILTWVISLPLWFVVFREMIPEQFQKPLVGLGALGTLHIVVTLLSGHAVVERLLLLLELSLAAGGAGWFIRFLGTVDVPKRVRQGLWFSIVGIWTRLALLTSIAGAIATFLGYTYFGEETAMVVTIGTIAATAWMALSRILEAVVSTGIHVGRLDGLRMIRTNRDLTSKWIGRGIRLVAAALFLMGLADQTSAWRPLGDAVRRWLSSDVGVGFAETGVTFVDVIGFFFILWVSWLVSRFVSFVLQEEVLLRLHMQPGVPYAIRTFTRYVIIVVGFIAAVSVLGIPLDRVTIMLSALGVGIGFGLQSLVNNFVSGFVLLTERPIRLRDKIEIEGVLGNVSSIGMRASTIRTFDGAEVIVPNGDLISQRVVNWTLSARQQRVTIPVGVAYGTDPNEVLRILRKVAADNEKVFKDPPPLALFRSFGDSSLDFELRIFMDPSDVLDVPSAVMVAIDQALKDANIAIPFPQRDLHLRAVPDGLVFTGPVETPQAPSTGLRTGTGSGTEEA